MFENFGVNISNLFKSAEKIRIELHHPYVGTEHLLLAILKSNDGVVKLLNNYGLNYDNFYKELVMVIGTSERETKINLYTPLLKRVISNSIENAKEDNKGVVTVKHLVLSMLEEGEGIAIRLLIGMNVDIDKLFDELTSPNKIKNKKLSIYEIGKSLNKSVDMNEHVIGRDEEIQEIIETLLRKKKNNPLLIGDAGVGKTAIVEELTRRIINRDVPESLYNKEIILLEMGSLVSGTKYRGEFEEKLTNILKEVESNKNIILFIDEIHTMVSAGGAEGAITAGDILKPALARGNIKCIGATTIYEYNKYFDKDGALKRRFETILIREPNKLETVDILKKIKGEYENHHDVVISDEILELITEYTDKFIFSKKNPDKSIDFLDSVCSYVKLKNSNSNDLKLLYDELEKTRLNKKDSIKNNNYDLALNLYNDEVFINNKINSIKEYKILVKQEDIISVLESKTNIPFTKEKLEYLNNVKEILMSEYVDYNNQVSSIIDNIKDNLLKMNSFVKFYIRGGSNIVNSISNSIRKVNIINLDMREFESPSSINKLIGSSYYSEDYIFNKIKNNNFNIVIVDNYEYACNEVKNIINKILDKKCIRDNKGENINFNNSIIFIVDNSKDKNIVGFNNNRVYENKMNVDYIYDLNENKCTSTS